MRLALAGDVIGRHARPVGADQGGRVVGDGARRLPTSIAPRCGSRPSWPPAHATITGAASRLVALTCHLGPPCMLRQPPVDAFQQVAQLRWRDRHRLALCPGPHEAAVVQALGEHAHPLAVVPQDLHQTTALAAEHEQDRNAGFASASPAPAAPGRRSPDAYPSHRSPATPASRTAARSSAQRPRHPAQRRFIERPIDPDRHAAAKLDLDHAFHLRSCRRRHGDRQELQSSTAICRSLRLSPPLMQQVGCTS